MAAKKIRRRVSRPRKAQGRGRKQPARAVKPHPVFAAHNLLRYAIWAAVASALGSGLVIGGAVYMAQRQAVPSLEKEIFSNDQGQMVNEGASAVEVVEQPTAVVVEPEPRAAEISAGSDWEASEPAGSDVATEASGGIQYYDSQHAFRLDFPSTWSGYEDRHASLDWGEQGEAAVVHFGFADNSEVLSLFVQSESQWNYWQEQSDNPYIYIGKNEEQFFSYTSLDHSDQEFIQRRIAEVPEVVASFRLLQHGAEQEAVTTASASNPYYQLHETDWQQEVWTEVALEYPKEWFAATAVGDNKQTVVFSPYAGSAEQPGITTDFIVDAYRGIGSLPGYNGQQDLEAYARSLDQAAESRGVGSATAWQISRADVIEWREVYVPVGENVYVLRVHAGHNEMNKFDHLLDAFLTRK